MESKTKENANVSFTKRHAWSIILNIIGVILCVILLPAFIVSTTLLISSFINPNVPPSFFGYTPLMVESGSMAPLFDEDDVVLIKNGENAEQYGIGTVICFHTNDIYVTHRIVGVSEENGSTVYTTQGDANNTPDEDLVYANQVLGVYQTHFDGMGKALMFIQTPVGMITCVLLPIVIIFILFTVPGRIEERKRMKKLNATENAKDVSEDVAN